MTDNFFATQDLRPSNLPERYLVEHIVETVDFDATVGEVSGFFSEQNGCDKRSPAHQARLIVNYSHNQPKKPNITRTVHSSKVNFSKMPTKGVVSTVLTEESEELATSSYGDDHSSVSKFNPLQESGETPSPQASA